MKNGIGTLLGFMFIGVLLLIHMVHDQKGGSVADVRDDVKELKMRYEEKIKLERGYAFSIGWQQGAIEGLRAATKDKYTQVMMDSAFNRDSLWYTNKYNQ